MKKGIWILIGIVVLVGAIIALSNQGGVLNTDTALYAYTFDGVSSDGGVVSVSFAGKQEHAVVNVLADIDNSGTYEKEEWVVVNERAVTAPDYRNNFTHSATLPFNKEILVRVVLTEEELPSDWNRATHSGEEVETQTTVSVHNLNNILGLDVPGARPELKRGAGVGLFPTERAFAQGVARSTQRGARTPDIGQGPMECSAVSAANNIISLADENGRGRDIPADQDEFIEELKRDMEFVDGILNENFKEGKDRFAARHGLPIETIRIDEPSWEDIFNALEEGAAVEMSMRFLQSASGHPDTGHTVTAVGASQDGAGNQSVEVHDPATPPGMDSLDLPSRIRAGDKMFEGVNYPMWDGIAFIDTIFIQRWVTEVPESPGVAPETEQARDQTLVEMLVIDGSYFPRHQFHIAEPDRCEEDHWHARGEVYGLATRFGDSVITRTDPAPNSCGFGAVGEVPVENINITQEQSIELIKHIP